MAGELDPLLVAREFLKPGGERGEGQSKSEWLFEQLQNHEVNEREALEEYREAIEKTDLPMAGFLFNLVRLDEEKHHEVIRAMSATLKKNLFWTKQEGALNLFQPVGPEHAALLPMVEKFIRLEKEGIKEYEKLLSDAKKMYHGLFELLLRTIIKDSEKHLMLLEYLKKYLTKAANARGA
jgi:rubrerythrin